MTEQELQAYVTELKRWEGHEPVAKKKFNEMFFTVGFGNYGQHVKEGTVQTEEESTIDLINNIKVRMPEIIDAMPNFDSFPLELKVPIVSSWFRGSIKKPHKTVKLINAGKFIEASKEFLRHDEYLHAEERGKRGIIKRMDATSQALTNYGEKKYKVEEQLKTILPADKDDIILKEEKPKKKIFEKLPPKQTLDVYSYLRERYEFSDEELDQGRIAGDEVLEDEIVLRTDQPVEKVIDPSWGQSEENLIAPQVIDYWKKLPPEKIKHPAWNWRQDSFLDTPQWEDLKSGWFDENILGLAYAAITHQEKLFPIDHGYNVYKDEKYKSSILENPDAFRYSFSQIQTEHILRQQYKKSQEYVSPFWYISGRVFGGGTDPASIFLFSKAAKPIFNAGRIKRSTKVTQIIGAEELLKQSINEERTWQEGAMIVGGTFLINMLLPTFKGKMTEEDIYHIKNHINSSDLQQEIVYLNKNKTIQIITGPTNRWRKPNGDRVDTKPMDMIPEDWVEVGAFARATENGWEIHINPKKIKKDFKNKEWTKPKVKGVKPLPKNQFKTLKEYEEFVMNHERAHTNNPRKVGESKGDYENRMNDIALKQGFVPRSQFKAEEYVNNKEKYLEELDNEAFANTWLGKFGEKSNWNPIQAVVNTGNLTAIKFVKSILKSSLFTKGNLKGIASGDALDQIMQLDMYYLGTAMEDIKKLYDTYRRTAQGKYITLGEFSHRVSKAMVNPRYVDEIDEVMKAKKLAREYYDYIGAKIKEANPNLHQQELIIAELNRKLKFTKGNEIIFKKTLPDGTTETRILTRKQLQTRIKNEEEYLKILRENPLRENYLNSLIKRAKIDNDITGWREFATRSIKRTMPELSDAEILTIVKSYENKLPWKSFNKFNPDKTHNELIIEEYIFSPSGMSGHLKARRLNINQEEWMNAGYLETDVINLMQMYHKSILPDIYLTSIFGTPNAMGGAYFRARGYQAGLSDVAAEYHGKWLKATSRAEKEKIIVERNEVLEYMEAVRDLLKGTYGVPTNPASFYSRGIKMLKLYNAMTSLQGGLASIVDLGRSVFFNGMNRSLRATMESLDKRVAKHVYAMTKKEGRLAGELFEMQLNTRAMLFNDLDNFYSMSGQLEAGMNKMSGIFFLVNLMTPWNQMIKTHQTMLVVTRILEESDNLVRGVITLKNKARLAQAGIQLEDAREIVKQYFNHGEGVGAFLNPAKLKEVRLAKSWEWSNKKIAKKFNLAVQNDVNIGIITPRKGDTPLWMSTQMGGLLAQFKKFSMGMTQRFLIRGLQEKDANFLGSIIMMVALGAIIDRIRSRAFDMDYEDKSYRAKMFSAFERSGVGGIFTDVANAAQRIMFADLGGKLSAGMGPTGSQIDKILNIISTNDDSIQAQNVRRLMPYQNIWYLDTLFDQVEKGIQ
jgi:hypothetical protein